jgi:hypothetical protein
MATEKAKTEREKKSVLNYSREGNRNLLYNIATNVVNDN